MPTLPVTMLALGIAALAPLALALLPARCSCPKAAREHPAPATPAAPPAVPPRPAEPPVPPRWYRDQYVAARTALGEGRTIIARTWISDLIDDCLLTFGGEHPYTRWAWELLAEITRTAIADLDRHGLTMDPHGTSEIFSTVLFPKGSPYTVVRDGNTTGAYRTLGATR